jgi:hypothetical protein
MKKDLLFVVFIVGLVMMFAIIGTGLVMMYLGKPIPETLSTWSNIAIGFLFGSMTNLVKDWSEDVKT